jgi:alkanesulfonate monooxygenase SsuD/methylene tetrahydromethanopterin reductase-like flavin-dependent oxidoreductase (luciferase family)
VIALGVQTWSTDVAAVERFWRVADELGYARITYGDGLWGLHPRRMDHAGGARAGDPARAHRPGGDLRVRSCRLITPRGSPKRAVTVDHLSRGRLDLRLAVGASDAETRAAWERHGIRYPDGRVAWRRLEAAVDVLDRSCAARP